MRRESSETVVSAFRDPLDEQATDAALSVIGRIEQNGLAAQLTTAFRPMMAGALTRLRDKPAAMHLCELVAKTVAKVFEAETLRLLSDDDFPRAPADTLQRLHAKYSDCCTFLSACADSAGAAVELLAKFVVSVRCAMLQPDYLTGAQPVGVVRLFPFLRRYCAETLAVLEKRVIVRRDPVMAALHGMSLTDTCQVKDLWREALESAMDDRITAAADVPVEQSVIAELTEWKELVVDGFLQRALLAEGSLSAADARAEVDRTSQELEQRLLLQYGRLQIDRFWDLVLEYPASTPSLQDLQVCLSRYDGSALHDELVRKAKATLRAKLHRAGTRTEQILTVVVDTIRSLCVLLSKNEQGSIVFAVVSDTLNFLRSRKDSVAALVRAIAQPSTDSILYSDLQSLGKDASDDEEGDLGPIASPIIKTGASMHDHHSWKYHRRPDVLRVLLSALSVTSIVEEYKNVLAQQLLNRSTLHSFATSAEEEVLERMKCVFGEDPLANCIVMLRDMNQSKRINQRIQDSFASESSCTKVSNTIVSLTCWPAMSTVVPPGEQGGYCLLPQALTMAWTVHDKLLGLFAKYAAEFKKLKPNQHLRLIPNQGRVVLDLKQRDIKSGESVTVPHTLSLVHGSIVLHVADSPQQSLHCDDLALRMLGNKDSPAVSAVLGCVQQMFPVILVLFPDRRVALQKDIVSAATFSFDSVQDDASSVPAVPPEVLEVLWRFIFNLLKNRGPKPAAEMHNSMKMFCNYTGSVADLKKLLQFWVGEKRLITADNNIFSLPKSV
jgi:anaphase-promoting complex subunit 2